MLNARTNSLTAGALHSPLLLGYHQSHNHNHNNNNNYNYHLLIGNRPSTATTGTNKMHIGIDQIARLAAEEAQKEQQRQAQKGLIGRKTTLGGAVREKGPSSLYIFSEDNVIRKNA
ncbi:hypothetical protein niasHS_013347 [Heterodera schachtii]|uniref:Uncharacterized protein n=1 Tax=Heterodera schachtii TaxID=97005 RepID=A0ABD2I3Q5_HETSC